MLLPQVTHEPHFCLLREVVSFSGGSRGRPSREVLENPCQESFILFQVGLLREYLELEFKTDTLPFTFDVERIIDDFVLFCMLIGNDFLPGMPSHIIRHLHVTAQGLTGDYQTVCVHAKLADQHASSLPPSKHAQHFHLPCPAFTLALAIASLIYVLPLYMVLDMVMKHPLQTRNIG